MEGSITLRDTGELLAGSELIGMVVPAPHGRLWPFCGEYGATADDCFACEDLSDDLALLSAELADANSKIKQLESALARLAIELDQAKADNDLLRQSPAAEGTAPC